MPSELRLSWRLRASLQATLIGCVLSAIAVALVSVVWGAFLHRYLDVADFTTLLSSMLLIGILITIAGWGVALSLIVPYRHARKIASKRFITFGCLLGPALVSIVGIATDLSRDSRTRPTFFIIFLFATLVSITATLIYVRFVKIASGELRLNDR